MIRKKIVSVLVALILAVGLTTAVYAASGFYVNDSRGKLTGDLGSCYAVGSGGTALLGEGELYALSADGVEKLDGGAASTAAPENAPAHTSAPQREPTRVEGGGGGLLYDDGEVAIASDTVKVGLRYYYSESRDTGVTYANLENDVGSGYEFGYFDEDREFVTLDWTDERCITMRRTSGVGIGVYITGTDELIYEESFTSADNMLAVRPICDYEDAVTWFAGNRYYGDFEYAVLGAGKISVINVVDMEKYVMGVCASEMSESWPLEALKAQAVCARTYAAKYVRNSTYYYNCGFDLTNDTYCQAYNGCTQVGRNITRAVESTADEYLTYDGELCEALYFSSDGGSTEDNYNVNGNRYHPYLAGVFDPYERKADDINSYSSWSYTFTPEQLGAKVGLRDVKYVDPTYSETDNVIALEFTASTGTKTQIRRSACRTNLGLPSIHYVVYTDSRGNFVFEGAGWGHNLGMSQFGAYAMARYYDARYEDILGYYFTGVAISYGYVDY